MLYGQLSLMMFLEYAIWGAWAPVLAAYLLGNMKLTGKQTGWIYATLWLACIVSPIVGGQIADRWVSAQYLLAIVQIAGGVLLLWAARQRAFWGMFLLMAIYSLLYAATLPLTNSVMFIHKDAVGVPESWVRVWGTIGWILAGWGLTVWRRSGKALKNVSDCLVLSGVMSLAMGVFSFVLPHTPPSQAPGNPFAFLDALNMLKDPMFLVFLVISFIVTTELQFYYIPTAQFLEDMGVRNKNVPAVMTVAQIAEILGMAVLLPLAMQYIGIRWVLVLGVIAWPLRYIVFAVMRPLWLVIASLTCHGVGYTFFFFAGQIFVNMVAPPDIKASAQGLIFIVTLGLGNFIGTQFTGVIMDYFRTEEGRFQWRPIFLIPCALTIACAVAFIVFFRPMLPPTP
jgi:nucleoside transporter